MPALPPQLFDDAVGFLRPFMASEDDRKSELTPVLSDKPVLHRIKWEGNAHAFTVGLIQELSYYELISILKHLHSTAGEDQRLDVKALCDRIEREQPGGASRGPNSTILISPPVPRLPHDYRIVGRDELVEKMKQRVVGGPDRTIALLGMPGVGKSTMAARLAWDEGVLREFCDGVLWSNLGRRGNAYRQLALWAKELHISQRDIRESKSAEELGRRVGKELTGQRRLLVVDDAWQPDSARMFLVGGPDCAHVVTTRRPDVALDFAGSRGLFPVKELEDAAGLDVLRDLAEQLVTEAPDEARELVTAVGGLPLALVLLGKHLRVQIYSGQRRRLQQALLDLRRAEERMRLSMPGYDSTLQAVVEISERALSRRSRRRLRALEVLPPKPNTFSVESAIYISASESVRDLQPLVDVGLLEPSGFNRYSMHKIVRDYLATKYPVARRILVSLNQHWQYKSLNYIKHMAIKAIFYCEVTSRERMARYFVKFIEDNSNKVGELDQESINVLAAFRAAADMDMHEVRLRGVNAFSKFLESRGEYELAKKELDEARMAALSLRDAPAHATALLRTGQTEEKRGDYQEAERHLAEGILLASRLGNYKLLSEMYYMLGVVAYNRSDYVDAEAYLRRGMEFALTAGNRRAMINILQRRGLVACCLGEFDESVKLASEGLELAREEGHPEMISSLLVNLAELACIQKRVDLAESHAREGLVLARELNSPELIGALTKILGSVMALRDDYSPAQTYFQESLLLFRKIGHRWYISFVSNALAQFYLDREQWDPAFASFQEGFRVAKDVRSLDLKAWSLFGLARIAKHRGDTEQALRLGQETLVIYQSIGHYSKDQVERWLEGEFPGPR